jgi:hypothetical protein
MLTVHLPQSEKAKPKQIEVQVAHNGDSHSGKTQVSGSQSGQSGAARPQSSQQQQQQQQRHEQAQSARR